VVREDGTGTDGKPILKAIRMPVKTGQRSDGKVAVLDGVKPGDQVVAAGQIKLQSGSQVIVTGNPPPQPPANPTPN
jgi:membrane fusion protein, multidrug efflux system